MKSLKILYGNNLKEKDSLIFSQIRNIIDGGGKVLYIVPEQYAFSADKSVLFRLGEKYSHLTETINFRRMALLVNEKFSPQKKNFVTEEIKNLICQSKTSEEMFEIIEDYKNYLIENS